MKSCHGAFSVEFINRKLVLVNKEVLWLVAKLLGGLGRTELHNKEPLWHLDSTELHYKINVSYDHSKSFIYSRSWRKWRIRS